MIRVSFPATFATSSGLQWSKWSWLTRTRSAFCVEESFRGFMSPPLPAPWMRKLACPSHTISMPSRCMRSPQVEEKVLHLLQVVSRLVAFPAQVGVARLHLDELPGDGAEYLPQLADPRLVPVDGRKHGAAEKFAGEVSHAEHIREGIHLESSCGGQGFPLLQSEVARCLDQLLRGGAHGLMAQEAREGFCQGEHPRVLLFHSGERFSCRQRVAPLPRVDGPLGESDDSLGGAERLLPRAGHLDERSAHPGKALSIKHAGRAAAWLNNLLAGAIRETPRPESRRNCGHSPQCGRPSADSFCRVGAKG